MWTIATLKLLSRIGVSRCGGVQPSHVQCSADLLAEAHNLLLLAIAGLLDLPEQREAEAQERVRWDSIAANTVARRVSMSIPQPPLAGRPSWVAGWRSRGSALVFLGRSRRRGGLLCGLRLSARPGARPGVDGRWMGRWQDGGAARLGCAERARRKRNVPRRVPSFPGRWVARTSCGPARMTPGTRVRPTCPRPSRLLRRWGGKFGGVCR